MPYDNAKGLLVEFAMICPTCGNRIDADSTFCGYCGAEIIPKTNHRIWDVGRDLHNDIVEDYPMVSGQHCRITLSGCNLFIEDFGSTNGTHLNLRRLPPFKKIPFIPSDAIHLGTHQLSLDPSYFNVSEGLDPAINSEKSEDIFNKGCLSVGRASGNDIVLDFPQISNEHAFVIQDMNKWYIEDRDSKNGTFVNDRTRPVSRMEITSDDILYFGSYKIPAVRIMRMKAGESFGGDDPQTITIADQETIFGRDPACTICLDYPQVSWHHARLVCREGSFFLEDLASTNGTYVNGLGITSCIVTAQDTISISSFTFRLTIDNKIEKKDHRGDIRIAAESITVEIYDKKAHAAKKLLDDVSLTIYPSEFVGVMGPSGSGKTTLLLALNGYLSPQTGLSLINGQSLYDNYDAFRNCIGYVPQDDIFHPELTVFEALHYTAKLRLPLDTTKQEINARIDSVLIQLGLVDPNKDIDTRNVSIGSAEKKGISGGQRKRLNLALELLTDPTLLFLDEPTSGLSSEDTIIVMDVLRVLASNGKTIILVIHQPSLEVYKKLDNLIVLSCGKLMYYGPAFPDSITFFNPGKSHEKLTENADNTLKGLSSRHELEWEQEYNNSMYFKKYVEGRKDNATSSQKHENREQRTSFNFILTQWCTLTSRYFTVKRKDRVNTAILFLQAPVIALLISLVFPGKGSENAAPVPLFLIIISALWFGISNSAREIVTEKAIYNRERMINLKIPAYVLSKYVVLGCFCLFQCAVLVGIIHPAVHLHGAISRIFCVTFLAALAGLSIGLFLSSLTRTQQAAIAIVPLVLLPMVILGGAMLPVTDMGESANVLSHFVPSRWAFEHVLRIEDATKEDEKGDKQETISNSANQNPNSVQHLNYSQLFFGTRLVEKESILFFVMGIYIFGFIGMTMFVLKLQDKI